MLWQKPLLQLIKLSDFGEYEKVKKTEDNSLKNILEKAKKQLKEIDK